VLDNAIKYSPPETDVTIAVSAGDSEIRIAVSDQGAGLGDGPVDMLTQRFQRGTNTQGVVGSGLGLTIAKDVLVAHGGRLELETLEGNKGTCATLVLPSS
ncbi:MAG: sensor histidine kinase, partial [Marivita lacus]|nr:sensor histidine kinase [Marivita lacus]